MSAVIRAIQLKIQQKIKAYADAHNITYEEAATKAYLKIDGRRIEPVELPTWDMQHYEDSEITVSTLWDSTLRMGFHLLEDGDLRFFRWDTSGTHPLNPDPTPVTDDEFRDFIKLHMRRGRKQ